MRSAGDNNPASNPPQNCMLFTFSAIDETKGTGSLDLTVDATPNALDLKFVGGNFFIDILGPVFIADTDYMTYALANARNRNAGVSTWYVLTP